MLSLILVTGKRNAPLFSSVNYRHLPMIWKPSPNIANAEAAVYASLNHKSHNVMEKLLAIHLINLAIHAATQIHALIVTFGHLIK